MWGGVDGVEGWMGWKGVDGVEGSVGVGGKGWAALGRAKLFADGHTELNAPDLF